MASRGRSGSGRGIVWDRGTLPTTYVSEALGVSRRALGTAIHRIKREAGMRGDAHIVIYRDGDVDDEHGNLIGNVLDEI